MENVKVTVGATTIVLNEEIINKLLLMKDSFYMQEELERINKKIIDLYNDGLTGTGGVIAPEEAMQMLSILKDVMGDYLFITKLDIKSENEPASV